MHLLLLNFYIYVFCIFVNATEDTLITAAGPKHKQKHRKYLRRGSSTIDMQCTNSSSEWCTVKMPLKRFFVNQEKQTDIQCSVKYSYFRFHNPPNDSARWEAAKAQALRGEQVRCDSSFLFDCYYTFHTYILLASKVLLKKILQVFPFYLDFLDGDTMFRNLHKVGDIFLDDNRDLSPLLGKQSQNNLFRVRND